MYLFLLPKYRPVSTPINPSFEKNLQPEFSNSIKTDLLSCIFVIFKFGKR